jgi:hypothetical protein
MREWFTIILMCIMTAPAPCQTASSKYQPGTIMKVTTHQPVPGELYEHLARYDVEVKVGNTIYTVLYTPPNGANGVEYSAGLGLLVLVGSDTLTFNSKLSGTTEVPILRREVLPVQGGPDLSKTMSQYFSMKEQHLSETLGLNRDQQIKIKPILEQEAGEAGEVLGNPALSPKEQLNRWEKIVRASDAKLRPLLSEAQSDKLQQLRQEQKKDLKRIVAEVNEH